MSILTLRIFNYSYFSLFAIFLSFLPVYLSAQGIPETQIGFILGIGGLIGIFTQPMWGILSDKRKTIKKILLMILGLSIGLGFVLFHSTSIWALVLLVGLMYVFFMPTDPLVESLNYQSAQRYRVHFGSIRMYGALGYATASLIIGYITESFGIASIAYLFLIYGLITCCIGLRLEDVQAQNKPIRLAELKNFISQRNTLTFFLLVLIIAVPHRINDTYIGIYITSIGGNLQFVGYSWFVMTLIEFLFFAIVHRFLKPGKELKIILIAGCFYALRFLLTSVVDHPALVVLLQLLQGVTFVFFYTAAIQYLYTIVPSDWKATGQTILAIIFFGISGVLASFVGGWIFEAYGGHNLYLSMTLLILAGIALCSLMIYKRNAVHK